MASILELTSDIVSSHASTSQMTSEELVQEIQKVHAALKALEAGIEVVSITGEVKPAITIKDAFKKNEVICLVCGKAKMKTLTRHLSMVHNMKPGEYRKQFGIASKQPLTAKSYSESRRKSAIDRGLGDVLVKAREVRAANIKAKKSVPVKAAKPKVLKNAAPAKTVKAATPKVAKKTDIPF
jgi:predicted transcriptional regulator